MTSDVTSDQNRSTAESRGEKVQHRKPHSHIVTDGIERAGSRGMLRAVGMGDDDWRKPQIGVASSWNEITPCNLSLNRLAKQAKVGVRGADGFPL
ncbi:MAG: dihydroxy-acid dehydratase [Frankiales bacterium]|nr:dihydroxy-acid dehydratase [Frankiales bacterium]